MRKIIQNILFTFGFLLILSNINYSQVPMKASEVKSSLNISEFEQINLSDGKFSLKLPLTEIGGRGSSNGLSLHINPRWRQDTVITGYSNGEPNEAYKTALDPYRTITVKPESSGYLAGTHEVLTTFNGCTGNSPGTWDQVAYWINFNGFGGESYTFRSVSHNGQPLSAQSACPGGSSSWGTEFISWDDTKVKFISDIPITFQYIDTPLNGYIKFPNGTTYRVEEGVVVWVRDRNGNKTVNNFSGISNQQQPSDSTVYINSIADSLNRQAWVTSESYGKAVNYRGMGNSLRTIKIYYGTLPNNLASGHSLLTRQQLFPNSLCTLTVGCTETNQIEVVSKVELPNGRYYRFYYNSYSEIAKIELPAGGVIEYDYESLGPNTFERRLKERRVYKNANNLENKTQYTYSYSFPSWNSQLPSNSNTIVKVLDSSANVLSWTKYYFGGCGSPSPCNNPDYPNFNPGDITKDSLPQLTRGKLLKTELYSSNGSNLLRKAETQYQARTNLSWAFSLTLPIDTRITQETSTLGDTNQISASVYGYDQTVNYNLQTDIYEYDYGYNQIGSFLRRKHTEYKKDSSYTNNSVNLLTLPSETWVSSDYNGNNVVSRTTYEYDNYASGTYTAQLLNRLNMTGHDSTFSQSYLTRGNLTKLTAYSNALSLTGAISTYIQYDIAGNAVKSFDAKGNASTVSYSDNFGTPDAEARTNSSSTISNLQLNGQTLQTFAFATSSTNVVGYTTYTQFDYYTGKSVDSEDIIGNVSSTFYNDLLDRPTQTISANNRSSFRLQTTINYEDDYNKVTVTSDSKAFNDNLNKSVALYDGMGRNFDVKSYEDANNYILTLSEYDSLGRAYRSSNPFRPMLNEQPQWTETKFDDLGRVVEIKSPDNGKVTKTYNGNSVRIYDQANRSRAGITDAIGRMTKVIEYDTSFQWETNYTFDVLGRLRKTSQVDEFQNEQNRYFMYDDLGRLIRAKQTEQSVNSNLNLTDPVTGNSGWSVKYEYDNNGNLTATTNARNITTTGVYDNLNRLTNRTYSDSTPSVSFTYDDPNIQNSKGQLTAVVSSVSSNYFTSFDELGRVKSSAQVTNGTTYNFPNYTYDLSGTLVEQTYPSGRVVKTETDNIGRLSRIKSQIPNQSERTYLSDLSYTSFGAVSQSRLGNGRWESAQFDQKTLQVTQIGLGYSPGNTSQLKINYNYGTTTATSSDNNGSLRQQTISYNGQSAPIVQNYTYDLLNRLKSAAETVNGTQTWKQTFSYDRFGNRRFDAANTTTLISNNAVYNPDISRANNKFLIAEGYNYDNEGNLTSNPESQLFQYDANSKQIQVTNSSAQTSANYFYDGVGKRVRKVLNNTEETIFVYDAFGKLASEYANVIDSTRPKATSYMTADSSGSPRIITDGGGYVISRHDYMPFGEEVAANIGGRLTAHGYQANDGVRQQFTGYERDAESGLDFAQNRYFANKHGRFTSVDPLTASASMNNPQTFNRYSYALNSPYKFTDPLGLSPVCDRSGTAYCTQGQESVEGDEAVEVGRGDRLSQQDFNRALARYIFERASQGYADDTGSMTTSMFLYSMPVQTNSSASDNPPEKYDFIVANGEPGTVQNVGQNFVRSAVTAAADLARQGYRVLNLGTITGPYGFQGLLDMALKYEVGGIAIYSHGGTNGIYLGDGPVTDTNTITPVSVKKLINRSTTLSSIFIYACDAGRGDNSIASQLAKQLNVAVHAATGKMIFSNDPSKKSGLKIHPNTGPTYMVHDGGDWKRFD